MGAEVAIINQKGPAHALPDFCNMGVALRILVFVNGGAILAAALMASSAAGVWEELTAISVLLQPILLLSLLTLCALRRPLRRLPYVLAVGAVLAIELLLTSAVTAAGHALLAYDEPLSLWRNGLACLAATGGLVAYFDLRARALSPALSEAKLQALQARIRPHFLFNSLNAVLSLIRSDPRLAEKALQDMADLFRVVMADNSELVPLERELALCSEYLELEQLRLGERLQVAWHLEKRPIDALVPPLILQPLLENAVYHGIEPSSGPGSITVNIYHARNQVHMVLRNPYNAGTGGHHAGNKMALQNIRERLALHFDAEGTLRTQVTETAYQVHIAIPYLRARP